MVFFLYFFVVIQKRHIFLAIKKHIAAPGSTRWDLSAKSASTVPESLLNIVNSPASYLDPADRRLLRRFRQKEKETILRRSGSDSDDEDEQASVSNSVSSNNNSVEEFKSIKEELQDDLNRIECNAHSFGTSSAEMIWHVRCIVWEFKSAFN